MVAGAETAPLGGHLALSYVRHLLPRLARKAGLERRVHAHGLRHAFAVHVVRSAAPLYVIRDALGHSSVATTQVYLSRFAAEWFSRSASSASRTPTTSYRAHARTREAPARLEGTPPPSR